jgi:hypothetical protein
MKRLLSGLFLAVLCAGLVSCASYRLGTGTEPAFSTLHVAVAQSDLLVPQAQALVTTQVREAFLRDGRLRLVNSPLEADATLTLTIEEYHRAVAVVRPDDTGLARRFEITLGARAELRDNRTLKMIFAGRRLVARRGIFADGGQIQAEYQNLPLLAEKLGDEAVRAVLDTW